MASDSEATAKSILGSIVGVLIAAFTTAAQDLAKIKADLQANPTSDFTIPNYLWLNPTSRQNITKLPNIKETKELLMATENVPPFEEEPHSLPENSLIERLLCYYGSKVTSAAYWGATAENIMESSVEFCDKNKRVRKIVKPFRSLATDSMTVGYPCMV